MSAAAASGYRPPRWLRNAHLQSVLAGSPLRRRRGMAALAAAGAVTRQVIVDGGDGVRLMGLTVSFQKSLQENLAEVFPYLICSL